ncbi:hypothetical protein [Pedobacter mucosus]|uniref:hypothetical protein n=1 Tax=Pedobacter mucosus TaxID=2895286 RepID=UPI001EE4912D|nr:hypothetical protein [Pedobacter mucosus]UKT65131.1 hypothetical protein LOK61_04970 [Pedobacter mucosus]
MKKILILVTALFLGVTFMAYFYFSKLGIENDAKDFALQSATNNAALVFSFQNDKSFYEILNGQEILQQILGEQKISLLKQIKESIINNVTINDFIKEQQIYVSILPDTSKILNFLLTVQIQPEKKIALLFDYLKSKNAITKVENELYYLKLNDKLSIYIGTKNQVLTASNSLRLVKNAQIRLIENPFTDYIKENNLLNKNVLAHIYINYNQAPLLLKNIITGNINGEISILNKQNSYAALNYNFSKERILFNGNTMLKSSDNYLKTFESASPQTLSIQNILPDNTANYVLYAFNDYKSWQNKLTTWQEQRKELSKAKLVINNIMRDYRIDLNSVFPTYVKNQFVTFQLSTSEKLAAISLSNGEKVKQLIIDVSADYNDEIKLFKASDILYSFFGEPFKKFGRPYYTIIDNKLIIANNASTIQSFLNSYKNNKLLIQHPEYLNALNQISSTSNISYYINNKNSTPIFRSNLTSSYYKHLRADSGLKSFDTFYYQMSSDKNKFITNLLLNKYIQPEIPDSLSNR